VLLASAAVLVAIPLAGTARADGDPASDILALQPLYLPGDAAVPLAQQLELSSMLRTLQTDGHPLRLAVIATSADLGSVSELWRQPQSYAAFLGKELSLIYKGPLLVVMPNGYGAYHLTGTAQRAAVARLTAPGAVLGTPTLTAVERFAASAGVSVSPAPMQVRNQASTSVLPWIAFAIGALLIAAAWTASFRARPPRLPHRRVPSPR
jgi:hypothetical protein